MRGRYCAIANTFLLFVLVLSISPCAHANDPARFALLIGNENYVSAVGPLKNPKNDIALIKAALLKTGFAETNITVITDADRVTMLKAFDGFAARVRRAGPNAISFFYYSGHGAANERHDNYLIPVDMSELTASGFWYRSVSLRELIDRLNSDAPAAKHFVIFDACRNTLKLTEPGGKGLSQPKGFEPVRDIPGGMLIAFATAEGELASDQGDGAGPYARALAEEIVKPGVEAVTVFRNAQLRVSERLGQKPWTQNSPMDAVYFAGKESGCSSGRCEEEKIPKLSEEKVAWDLASASHRLEDYQTYLLKWPNGLHQQDALAQIERLKKLSVAWRDLAGKRNFKDLAAFVDAAAGTEFEPLSKFKLDELMRAEAPAWELADNARQLSSYTQFLKTWPDGPHKDIALARQNELIDIRDSWTRIHNSDDEQELEAFIAQFGWSEFGARATDRLVSIRREKKLPPDKGVVTLAADDMARLLDGAVLTFPGSGATISFFSSLMPSYRISLGKDFLTRQFNQSFAAEGVFRAEFSTDDRQTKFDGLGGIVRSKVDSTGSLFLVQMLGTEKTSRDVDNRDRKYATFQIIRDAFGYVCIGTNWQSILSREEPKKVVERCTIRR